MNLMKCKFVLTDQGELGYYLRFEVSKIDENTLLLYQTGHAKKIPERFNMTECKVVKTPLLRDLNLSLMDFPNDVDPIQVLQSDYRAKVGSLMYLYLWTRETHPTWVLQLRFCQGIFTDLVRSISKQQNIICGI